MLESFPIGGFSFDYYQRLRFIALTVYFHQYAVAVAATSLVPPGGWASVFAIRFAVVVPCRIGGEVQLSCALVVLSARLERTGINSVLTVNLDWFAVAVDSTGVVPPGGRVGILDVAPSGALVGSSICYRASCSFSPP